MNDTSNYTDHRNFFLGQTLITEKTYDGDKLAFGILIKKREDYEYFRQVIMDNKLSIDTCSIIALNMIDNKLHDEIED